jgi:hypothetical protein
MPLGYKYAERDTDSYVDWSAVGKNLSDALGKEAEDRRTKIKEFEDQNLADIDFLNRAPQGAFTDATDFTNNFAHDAKQQSLINYRLLRAGKMDPRQYTLNRQNMMNGTNLIFDLQKTYQKEFDDTMAGVQSGDLQSLNIANMSMVEKYGDFTKSKAVINPLDGTVNIGMMQLNPKTGVMELSKDVMPVSLAMNKISTKIKTFKVDEAIDNSIKAFGDKKDAIYSAATTSGAGTITELLGVEALAKYPKIAGFKNTVDSFNEAVNTTIAGYFSGNKYNLSSVLTENTGKYNADSYTYDKDLAAKDKTKLLLKVDPNTKLNVLDESAPHYAEQKKEAEGWVRTQIMNRLDSERKISTTQQSSQLRATDEGTRLDDEQKAKGIAMAKRVGKLITGTPQEIEIATASFNSIPGQRIEKTKDAYVITKFNDKGEKTGEIPYYLTKDGVPQNPLALAEALIPNLNVEGIREDYIQEALPQFIKPNSVVNTSTTARGFAATRNTEAEFANKVNKELVTSDIFYKKEHNEASATLIKRLGGIKGIKITPTGWNSISIQYENGKPIKVNSNQDTKKLAVDQKTIVMNFLNELPKKVKEEVLGADTQEQKIRLAENKKKGTLELDN